MPNIPNCSLHLYKVLSTYKSAMQWIEDNKQLSNTELWNMCERADWMLWITERISVDHRLIVLATYKCCQMSADYTLKDHKPLVQKIYDTVKTWAEEEATPIAEVKEVYQEASKLPFTFPTYAAVYTAYTALCTRREVDPSVHAVLYAAGAISVATCKSLVSAPTLTYVSARNASQKKVLKSMATFVREAIPANVYVEALEKFAKN